jgi:hypothetical protein
LVAGSSTSCTRLGFDARGAGRCDSGFTGLRVERVSFTLPGELVDVRVPRGQTVDKLDGATRAIAGCLRVTDVRVVHDREDRSHAQLSIIRRDPFQAMSAMSWPLLRPTRSTCASRSRSAWTSTAATCSCACSRAT